MVVVVVVVSVGLVVVVVDANANAAAAVDADDIFGGCLRGALLPVDLRAVCLVRAILNDDDDGACLFVCLSALRVES